MQVSLLPGDTGQETPDPDVDPDPGCCVLVAAQGQVGQEEPAGGR